MSLLYRIANILLVLFVLYPPDSDATNFAQCFAGVVSCANDSGSPECSSLSISNTTALSILRTSKGLEILSPAEATALSYRGCVNYCGATQEPFSWTTFSQDYSAWLLPYLALLSQLPFGARLRTENLMSAILTLGSPTLAGYSLYVTLLNSRWVNDQLFAGIDYPSAAVRQSVVCALSSLQHVPLRIHPGKFSRFESLVVHPDNDEWWKMLATELDYSHTWSIASATSITWVVVAYLLTVAVSISDLASNINSSGEGTGSVWLWLLPIVVGWLILSPKCDYKRVHDAYRKANKYALVADPQDPSAAPTDVISGFGLTITPSLDLELDDRYITSPDELQTPPVFNYARILPWSRAVYITSLFYRAAWQKSQRRVGVDGKRIPGNVHSDIPRENRLGTRDQIIRYCRPDDHECLRANDRWSRGVFLNMIVASLMSLQLQWGTTASAVLTVWFTPTIGLGCRSLAYLLYGSVSTTVWFLLVSSSFLGYYAHRPIDEFPSPDLESNGQRPPRTPSKFTKSTAASGNNDNYLHLREAEYGNAMPLQEVAPPGGGGSTISDEDEPTSIGTTRHSNPVPIHAPAIARVADLLRWVGKSLAIVNAIGIIANSVFQYAGLYDNCFCNSSVFTWGSSAFNVITPIASDIELASNAWIGALALALTCSAFFVGTIYLLRDSLPS